MRVQTLGKVGFGDTVTPSLESSDEARRKALAWATLFGGLVTAGGLLLFATGRTKEGYAVAFAGAVTSAVLGFVRVSSDR